MSRDPSPLEMLWALGGLFRSALKQEEQQHPERVEALPAMIPRGLRFVDGTEAGVEAGKRAWDEGRSDPNKLPDAQVLAWVPEVERRRFAGTEKQLAAAVRGGYLYAKTIAVFKAAAAGEGQ